MIIADLQVLEIQAIDSKARRVGFMEVSTCGVRTGINPVISLITYNQFAR
jgi:hypothetical protein